MTLVRTALLIETISNHHTGYETPGAIRKSEYPAGQLAFDDEYPDTPEGHKFAQAHAWRRPSKRIKAGSKIYRY